MAECSRLESAFLLRLSPLSFILLLEPYSLFSASWLTSKVPELVEKYRQEKLVAEASMREWCFQVFGSSVACLGYSSQQWESKRSGCPSLNEKHVFRGAACFEKFCQPRAQFSTGTFIDSAKTLTSRSYIGLLYAACWDPALSLDALRRGSPGVDRRSRCSNSLGATQDVRGLQPLT